LDLYRHSFRCQAPLARKTSPPLPVGAGDRTFAMVGDDLPMPLAKDVDLLVAAPPLLPNHRTRAIRLIDTPVMTCSALPRIAKATVASAARRRHRPTRNRRGNRLVIQPPCHETRANATRKPMRDSEPHAHCWTAGGRIPTSLINPQSASCEPQGSTEQSATTGVN
jgi:hypothetical protein